MENVDPVEAHVQRYLNQAIDWGKGSIEQFLPSVPERLKDKVRERILELEAIAAAFFDEGRGLSPGDTVAGRCKLIGVLGAGSFGEVWRALDHRLEREVALKVQHAHWSIDPAASERMKREARALASISGPGAVRVFDLLSHRGRLVLVTEIIGDGETLAEQVARLQGARGRCEIEERINRLLPAFDALAEAHILGILHRDIKPTNLLWDGDFFRVSDFGMASRPSWETLTSTGASPGTLLYSSPEQIRGEALGPQSDVWSIAATLIEYISGKRLISGQSMAAIREEILTGNYNWKEIRAAIPKDLLALLQKALENSPKRRHEDAGELARDLRLWLAGDLTTSSFRLVFLRGRRWFEHNRGEGVIILTLLFVLCFISYSGFRMFQAERLSGEVVSSLQGVLRGLDPLVPETSNETLSQRLKALGDLAAKATKLPNKERAQIFETLGNTQMALDDYKGAAVSFGDALRLVNSDDVKVKLAWCHRDSDPELAKNLLGPIASRDYGRGKEADFVTAFARNRLGTLLLGNPQSLLSWPLARDTFQAVEVDLISNGEYEKWLLPLNALNLATAFSQLENYETALSHYARAEELFIERGMGMHPETFYIHVGRHHAYWALNEYVQGVEALQKALDHRNRTFGPKNSTTLNIKRMLCKNLIELGCIEKAEHEFNELLDSLLQMEGSTWVSEIRRTLPECANALGMTSSPKYQQVLAALAGGEVSG